MTPENDRYHPAASATSASETGPVKQCRMPMTPMVPASWIMAAVSSTASRVCTTTGKCNSAPSANCSAKARRCSSRGEWS